MEMMSGKLDMLVWNFKNAWAQVCEHLLHIVVYEAVEMRGPGTNLEEVP